jgi:hypothetical protein
VSIQLPQQKRPRELDSLSPSDDLTDPSGSDKIVCPIQKKPNDGSRQEAQFDSVESEDEGEVNSRRIPDQPAGIVVGSAVMAPVGLKRAKARVKSLFEGSCVVEFDDAEQTLVDHATNVFSLAELEPLVVGTLCS